MVECIDLLALIKAYGRNTFSGTLYGRVFALHGRPSSILPSIYVPKDGMFVEVDVQSVDLSDNRRQLEEQNVWNGIGMYKVNGSLYTLVRKSNIIDGEMYRIEGVPLNIGSRDLAVSKVVSGIKFYMGTNNTWGISPLAMSKVLQDSYWGGFGVEGLPRFQSQELAPVREQQNVMQDESVGYTEIRFKRPTEAHGVVAPLSEKYVEYDGLLRQANSRSYKYLLSLKDAYAPNSTDDDRLRYMLHGLQNGMTRKSSNFGRTGKAILKDYLSNFNGGSKAYIGKSTAADYLIAYFGDVAGWVLGERNVTADGAAWELCRVAFGDRQLLYAGVVSQIVKISFDSILKICEECAKLGISVIRVLNENPYLMQFFGELSFYDIERLACVFNRSNSQDVEGFRNLAILDAEVADGDRSSTALSMSDIFNGVAGLKITEKQYKSIVKEGTLVRSGVVSDTLAYIHPNDVARYSPYSFKKCGSGYVRKLRSDEQSQALKDYESSGLGVLIGNYITSSSLLRKELFVYKTMYDIASKRYNYVGVDDYISEYEAAVGFKLEERQREAVHLVVNGAFVVAGSAGSGKTTVSKCIVHVLNRVEPGLEIKFAAPTGKAAKRMQEVVQQRAHTLHSLFKIGIGGSNSVFSDDEAVGTETGVAYFIDEGAMVSLELMYQVMRRIDTATSRVFFFGDYNQLPPIGKGLPFMDLLRFMPCVFLNVSKRAAEGSKITYNSNLINEDSDFLESGGDFRMVETSHVSEAIRDICRYYLNKGANKYNLPQVPGVVADDIQVVTPYATQRYDWGSESLNMALQPVFNGGRSYAETYVYKGTPFRVGDRVIHTSRNMYSMQWYERESSDTYRRIYGYGICNGEVGELIGFINGVSILEEREEEPSDFEYPENLRDDETWPGWFVVVRYYDYMDDRHFYILYRADEDGYTIDNRGTCLKGDDLERLSLFYAGTVHKLQGSQARIVIVALGDSSNYNGHISRQLLYTAVTRGQELVILVGSVSRGSGSMLSRARKVVAGRDTITVGQLISE